jgi:capsular exopolysaccharide synthesis family protein
VQHNIFGVDGKRGISNVITGNMTLNEAIQAGPVENLHILTSGTDVPNPSELLNSTAFEKLLNELCQKYDRVLIDSPPVLPVADSHILGATCDISILVLRAEKTTRKAGQAARDILMSVGSHLLGAVVNSVASKHGGYGYYNRYGYGYGYGYGNEYGYGNRKEKSATQTADKMQTK